MKQTILLMSLAAAILISGGNNLLSRSQWERKYILDTLKKYSPTGYHIVKKYDMSPNEISFGNSRITMSKTDFMMYARGYSKIDLVSSLNTIVHETCHGYTGRMAYFLGPKSGDSMSFRRRNMAIYTGGENTIIVQITKNFPAREIAGSFSETQKSLRFNTYVNSSQKYMGTQVNGIYGLLDELNAYYHGTRSAYDMLSFYKKQKNQDARLWQQFFQGVNGTYYAHLEFKLFILKYLQYARKNHSEIYSGIMANKNFRDAFNATDKNFSQLIEDYFNKKNDIFSFMKKKGIDAKETSRGIMFKSGRGYMGMGNFLDTYNMLKKELAKKEFQEILKELSKS